MDQVKREDQDTPKGLVLAITAYVLWGFLPLYMKALAHVPAAEVVVHRILWSVPVAAAVLIVLRRTNDLRAALRTPRTLLMGCVTAALISLNWGTYVWAISAGRALDAALGYYINPLFSIALAALVLGEKLTKAQKVAIGFAALAVVILTIDAGTLPWVSIVLTISWGFYALAKKSLPVGPNQGFLLEVLILTPPALGYLVYLSATGAGHFTESLSNTILLMGCGLVTAVPLIVYANGAKLVRLSTIGVLQYIAPTMIFLTAVLVFKEEFSGARWVAFPLIWLGLVIYTVSMISQMRRPVAKG
ncbi:chloramphenicol-sensitive protein RarD [Epibacterium ulvae]|uniref:Chloramphenicol-sensitive protein RarD n=1 Tax=Epibacterium ulvae TaxID=1156985 RepID=A0A1G5QZP9_9RHOB|nr:EamA family transporter RarD [Epibacterium ulvae]SCZ66549.1 chloramphenicol-sensitive protein RarD [Epibacterium ulvae]